MTKFVRLAALAAAATVAATPAFAAPVGVTGQVPKASVRIVKPLTLTRVRDLNFGTLVVGTVTGTQTVNVSDAGVETGCANGVTCQGVGVQSASYNVTGTNNQTVNIVASNVTLRNANSDPLVFTPNWTNNTVLLTSSGSPGNDFDLGGSITVDTNTPEGLYSGDLIVTVDY